MDTVLVVVLLPPAQFVFDSTALTVSLLPSVSINYQRDPSTYIFQFNATSPTAFAPFVMQLTVVGECRHVRRPWWFVQH